jgi:hypothetical protein
MATKEEEYERIAQRLFKKIEFQREEAKERRERFEALTREELLQRITGKTSKSPYFYMQSWGNAGPGGSITYRAWVHNPDPTSYSGFWLFGYLFFGPANFIISADVALTTCDDRFPHYLQRCGVAADSDASMTFEIDVPATISPGIYIGNCFLVRRSSFDVGGVFDRAAFDLEVS